MLDLGKIGYKVEIDDKKYTAMLKKMEGDAKGTANNIGSVFRKALAFLGGAMLFREGLRGARMFSDELANIKSIAGELNTRALRREITNLSSDLGSSAELANALYYAYSAGVRGTEKELAAFAGQMAQLAKTVGAEATPIMDAATTMMNAYGLSVKDAGMLSDWFYQIVKSGKTTGSELAQSLGQIAATAASSGISIDELGAALATLTTTMPTNIAVTSLAASIRALMNPTDDVKKQATALGIELSMAAIKAKGFAGVMEDIYQKTQGRGDLIGKLFPAESSRAIMALAGTQISALKQNILDFGNKGGAAAIGFAEKMQSLDERIKALQVTGQKILTVLADTVIQVVTLGGVLNPLLKNLVELKEEGIALTAKLLAMAAGLVLLRKVQAALMLKAQAVEMARLTAETSAKTAATNQETAAIVSQTAAIRANKAARNLPESGGLGADDFRRRDIQGRWDARNARRVGRLSQEADEFELYQRNFGGGASVSGMPKYRAPASFGPFNVTPATVQQTNKLTEALSTFGEKTVSVAGNVATLGGRLTGFYSATGNGFREMGSAVGRGIKSTTSVLTGGLKGLSGAANMAASSMMVVGTAIAGWNFGKWLADVSGLKNVINKLVTNENVDMLDQQNQKAIDERNARLQKQRDDVRKAQEDKEKKAIADQEKKAREDREYQAGRDYQYTRVDTKTRIDMLNADLLNAQARATSAKDPEKRTKAVEDYWKILPQIDEAKRKQEEELDVRKELNREISMTVYRAKLAKDGEISGADKLLLKDKEIEQQQQRVSEAADRVKKARQRYENSGGNQKEYDAALKAIDKQESAQSKLYQMQNQQRLAKIDYSNEQRSFEQQKRMNEKIYQLRLDGEYSIADQIEVQEQKLKDMASNAEELKKRLADKTLGRDLREKLQIELGNIKIDTLNEGVNLKRLKESGRESQGSFSAKLLAMMAGSSGPVEQTAENTRKSLQETRKVRENLEKTPVLKYGSK